MQFFDIELNFLMSNRIHRIFSRTKKLFDGDNNAPQRIKFSKMNKILDDTKIVYVENNLDKK